MRCLCKKIHAIVVPKIVANMTIPQKIGTKILEYSRIFVPKIEAHIFNRDTFVKKIVVPKIEINIFNRHTCEKKYKL